MKKINIAELLKDCPKGMELDCTLYDNCTFEGIEDIGYINILVKTPNGQIKLSKEGCIIHNCNSAKCVIFPKGKTTWEGFQRPSFKDGDIVTYKYENKLVSMILNKFVNFVEVHYHCALYDNAIGFVTNNYIVGEPKYTHLATEEEKQKLFDVIKENGYKWNAETRTLEKLVEPNQLNEDLKKYLKYQKQKFIEKAKEWLEKSLYIHTEEIEDKHWNEIKTFDWVTSDFDSVSDFIEGFCKAMEK